MTVESPTQTTTPAQVESALRTFLTADVRGYTRFTQEFGDEAAARLATKFAAVSREVVSNFGGRVVELRGDEALAVFVSARQALRASIQLQHRFAFETEQDAELPLRVGIGLDAGEVVTVEEGYRGGALNLAQRLSSLAGPGEVLASDVAVQLARKTKGLLYWERGLVDLKGFADPVRVIRILDESDPSVESLPPPQERNGDFTGSNGHEADGDTPLPIGGFLGALPEGLLVARDAEFDEILTDIQAVERGTGRLVLLSGEPGVGKTRLAQEVTLKARNHSFIMASGRCYEPEANVPFYPFLEVLATLYAVCPPHIRQQMGERWPEIQKLLPNQLTAQTSLLAEGQEQQLRLFWAITGFMQAVAAERPVAVLLDDLHWADTSTLELLQHLARHTRASRILLLGTYRDVEVNRQHPLESALTDLSRERLIHEISVRRLDESGTAGLVSATLGGAEVASRFVHLVYRHTEGNPFFVEEVVRTLVERGDVYRVDGRWEGRAIEEIEVPKSVRSVVGQRLSRLTTDSQSVLREASVLGPAFTFEDLSHMCERSESELEAALEEALRAALVRETGRDSYAFNHALTQGTLYSELPSRRRRRLHLAAGKALERLPETARRARIAELAWHFLEADEPEPALEYALAAGHAARELFAYDEAERHYRTALELANELHDARSQVRAYEELGRILRTVARYDEALENFESAVDLHRASGNTGGERWSVAQIGRVHALKGTPEVGLERVLSMVNAIESTSGQPLEDTNGSGSWNGRAALYTTLADLYQVTNQSTAQLEAAEKALDIARTVQDSKAGARIQAEGQMWRASALAELGELQDARRMLEDVIPLAEATGDGLILSRSLNSLAMIYSEAGQYQREQTYIERALQAAEQAGDPTRVAFMNHRMGWHLLMRGTWDEAETYFQRAVSMWRPLGWTRIAPWSLIGLATLAFARGNSEAGEHYLEQGKQYAARPGQEQLLALAHHLTLDWYLREGRNAEGIAYHNSIPDWGYEADWHYGHLLPLRAWATLVAGNVDGAKDFAEQAIELSTAEQNRTTLTDALRVHGIILASESSFEEAENAFEESIATATAVEQPYPLGRSLYHFGLVKVAQNNLENGEEILTRSADLFDSLGAKPDAMRARQALDRIEERSHATAAGLQTS